jgi:TATA-box binding protein (TBP) (component of TFIID and TFIIIB)
MNNNFNLDEEWEKYMLNTTSSDFETNIESNTNKCELVSEVKVDVPTSTKIYISTKTKIAYLNNIIDLKNVFWKIPIISYNLSCDGIVKKQMKFNSTTLEELNLIQENLKDACCCEQNIITHIDNPFGRIKFKDIRKVSVGISKKDILSHRSKKKSAFYNCFVMILRLKVGDIFKEFHIKIFNTGKLEIPGVQCNNTFQIILDKIIEILQPQVETGIMLEYKDNTVETVLINSNFNCGFYINREILCEILKKKYNLQTIYDPCSYPGIQCKFYYNPEKDLQNGFLSSIETEYEKNHHTVKKISLMIFRTGSVLIVGKCDENVLMIVYEHIKQLLHNEYFNISQTNVVQIEKSTKEKNVKIRKKKIIVDYCTD